MRILSQKQWRSAVIYKHWENIEEPYIAMLDNYEQVLF